jgi:hypothetical protein
VKPWAPLLWWLVTALVLSVAVAVAVGHDGALDDPQPGEQRPGLLTAAEDASVLPAVQLPGAPLGRRPVLLIFDRVGPSAQALTRVQSVLPDDFATVVVVPDDRAQRDLRRARLVADPSGRLARAVGMPTPRDGGPPVGYALIDRRARVRYATLDPEYTEHAFEVEVLAGALS